MGPGWVLTSMKNQYLGDNKDLFTYDLALQVMRAGLVRRFTLVPMLTPDDGTGHGAMADREKARAGTDNRELAAFLDGCRREGRRDISRLAAFFAGQGVAMTIYGSNSYFSHRRRGEYFAGIGGELLTGSLVLVDPDTGLEVKRPGAGHLLYDEAADLYRRMDKDSILMLYQYLPRRPRQEYLNRRCQELKDRVSGEYPVCLDDGEIAFFFLTKDEDLEHRLAHVIADYARSYS